VDVGRWSRVIALQDVGAICPEADQSDLLASEGHGESAVVLEHDDGHLRRFEGQSLSLGCVDIGPRVVPVRGSLVEVSCGDETLILTDQCEVDDVLGQKTLGVRSGLVRDVDVADNADLVSAFDEGDGGGLGQRVGIVVLCIESQYLRSC
jgi:hypothetical protein